MIILLFTTYFTKIVNAPYHSIDLVNDGIFGPQANDILLDAARRGKTEVVKALIHNKANVNHLKGQVLAL